MISSTPPIISIYQNLYHYIERLTIVNRSLSRGIAEISGARAKGILHAEIDRDLGTLEAKLVSISLVGYAAFDLFSSKHDERIFRGHNVRWTSLRLKSLRF